MKRQVNSSVCLVAGAILSACSATAEKTEVGITTATTEPVALFEQSAGNSKFDQLVSQNLVSVIKQVHQLEPLSTTLGISDPSLKSGAFADALKEELEIAGYALRSVGSSKNTLPLSLMVEEQVNDTRVPGESQTVTVIVGDYAVRRTYVAEPSGAVTPLGTIEVRGIDAKTLQYDDAIFSAPISDELRSSTSDSRLASVDSKNSKGGTLTRPRIDQNLQSTRVVGLSDQPLRVEEVTREANESRSAYAQDHQTTRKPLVVSESLGDTSDPQRQRWLKMLSNKRTENVRDLDQSNFESLFSTMGIVEERVLIFDNDSAKLGAVNKAILSKLLDQYDANRDVVSVIGCSHGPTSLEGGQAELALGRAMRVRDELLYAGISEERILAEGCWADHSSDQDMPPRGVVVSVKRPIG